MLLMSQQGFNKANIVRRIQVKGKVIRKWREIC